MKSTKAYNELMDTRNKNYKNPSPKRSKLLPPLNDINIITLPREVLKWIQSLDLTYSVKNVKKDFNNGFLIAQILSRYFPEFVPMHTIDNGSSLEAKQNNWELIEKYIIKINLFLKNKNLPSITIKVPKDILIDNKENEVLTFLIQLYGQVTKKEIKLSDLQNIRTDIDDINKPYLLKDTGEMELLKKDFDSIEKKSEDNIQKSLSIIHILYNFPIK